MLRAPFAPRAEATATTGVSKTYSWESYFEWDGAPGAWEFVFEWQTDPGVNVDIYYVVDKTR